MFVKINSLILPLNRIRRSFGIQCYYINYFWFIRRFFLETGPAECLFHESYFSLMRNALKPGGIVCSQAGTAWTNLEHVAQTFQHCKSVFPVVSYGIVAVPTYPTGQIGFVLGSLSSVSTHAACGRSSATTSFAYYPMKYLLNERGGEYFITRV